MKCFAFVVHHKCSYVDGMVIVAAETYEKAVEILKTSKQKDVLRRFDHGHPSFDEDPIIDEGDKVLDHYPEDIPDHNYGNVWCLYHTFLSEEADGGPGIKAFAYHDG